MESATVGEPYSPLRHNRNGCDARDLEGVVHGLTLQPKVTESCASAAFWAVSSPILALVFIWLNLSQMNFALFLEYTRPLGDVLGLFLNVEL